MHVSWRQIRYLVIGCVVIFGASYIPMVKDFVRYQSSPFIIFARHLGERAVTNIRLVTQIATLSQENGQLRAKINEMSALEVTNTELNHENDLLRKELSLSTEDNRQSLIAAQVISRSSSVNQQSLVINKGSDDGFAKGMAVIAQGYLVGSVEEALPKTSQVTLLVSAQSLLPVVLQNSRSLALLKGGISGIVADEIPRNVTISPGEAVVTANTGDIIKNGIPVGKVSAVLSGKSDVFQSARVASPVDFSRLEVVFGVK